MATIWLMAVVEWSLMENLAIGMAKKEVKKQK